MKINGNLAVRLPPGGRDALRKYAGGIFLAKAGSKLCLRPGPKAGALRRAEYSHASVRVECVHKKFVE